MASNTDIITDAYKLAGVLAENITLQAEQLANGLRWMNEMLAEWGANGIDVGYNPQTSGGATSPVYSDAMRAVKYNLALEVAGNHQIEAPLTTLRIANDSYGRLLRDARVAEQVPVDMSHLPEASRETFDIENG